MLIISGSSRTQPPHALGRSVRAPPVWRARRGLGTRIRAASVRCIFWLGWQKPMTAGCGWSMVLRGEEVRRAVLLVRGEQHAPDLNRSRDSYRYGYSRRGRGVGGEPQYYAAWFGCP